MLYKRIVGWCAGAASGWFLFRAIQNWIEYFGNREAAANSGFFDSIAHALAAEVYYRAAVDATKWFVMVAILSILCEVCVAVLTRDRTVSSSAAKDDVGTREGAGSGAVAGEKLPRGIGWVVGAMLLILSTFILCPLLFNPFPVSISARKGKLSDSVLIVSNTSESVSRKVKVAFDYKKAKSSSEKVLQLKPKQAKELGFLELLHRPQCGDKGRVSVLSEDGSESDGMSFELIENGGCRILR